MTIAIFFVLVLKSSMPKNLIYGIKSKKNIKHWFKSDLKKILDQDVFFGIEPRYIYSLKAKVTDNIWEKEKIYDKYTKKIRNDIKNNYEIFYKKLEFELNIEKIENNIKIQ
jgi:hypothetical protein